jgi:hypothetical protein
MAVLGGAAISYERGTPVYHNGIPQVASRLTSPTVGPYDLPGTSLGSNVNLSPLEKYITTEVQGHLAHKRTPLPRTLQ